MKRRGRAVLSAVSSSHIPPPGMEGEKKPNKINKYYEMKQDTFENMC